MKIALIGYGKMGRLIEDLALQNEHQIIAKIHPNGLLKSIESTALQEADVCIDFSTPQSAIENIRSLAALKKNIVMGTTGWYAHMDEVKQLVKEQNIGFIFSPNFSIGVHLFKNIVSSAAELINLFDEYDIAGHEIHHNQKIDSPSGTAKYIVHTLLEKIKRKTTPVYELLDRPIATHELHFPCIRCGSTPGTHSVIFDSPADTITISHQARNREGFAVGALTAAEWLNGRSGFFTLDDMINFKLVQ
ncbi:MAG: 4-hydroxy-tetrahydrodipicolinate reductase [Chlamydiales bacterium 38-26]|nr:4-hydroxy-tetrahydrodipicolinate reductase [Chlamydiales bacterium]OJV07699.1 MAG: 4-hydroxy-tetrahydrodipicolinate reductase [Chlamydiales bacterium 38-26]